MEPTDFAPTDGFLPVDPPVFLGLDPLLLIGLILLLLAVAGGMYLLGRWNWAEGGGSRGDRACDEIYDAILKASTAAMSAGSDDLKARAETLKSVIIECLGPVLTLGTGVGAPFGKLKDALDSKGPAAKAEGHPPPAVNDTGRPVTINQIYVGGPAAADHGEHGHGDHGHKPGGHGGDKHDDKRTLTGPEQVEALGVAVRKFHDHWARRPERIRELRDARLALSRRPPARLMKSSGEGRVWDHH